MHRLIFAMQKTKHYLVKQTIYVISIVNPFRILMIQSHLLNSRLAKWVLVLSQCACNLSLRKQPRDKLLQTPWLIIRCLKILCYTKPCPMKSWRETPLQMIMCDKYSSMELREWAKQKKLLREHGQFLSHLRVMYYLIIF